MYPLSFDQRVQELDNLREDTLRLESKLSDIRKACEESSLCPNPIVECPEHMSQIAQAYKEFYLSDEPNRWHSNLKKYREDLQAMFNDPGEYTLADIHERARNELRQAQRSDLCTIRPDDSEETIKWKNESAAMFDEGKSVTDIIDHRLKSQLETLPESEAAEKSHFLKALEDSRDSKDRARAYVDYYCHQMPNDSREKASLKAKFAKMFQDGISHDILMTMMVKQVTETGATKKSDLENKLSELQMAQSAFLKNKAKKEETVSRRLQAQVEAEKTVTCSFPECNAPVNLLAEDGPLECAICEWLSRRSSSKSQFFYCSIEHAEKDFVSYFQSTILRMLCSVANCIFPALT